MKKQYRIKKSTEIDAIIKKRQSYGNGFFVIYYKENCLNHFRFAISIGKKYGNSVKRNLMKRRIRSVFRELQDLLNNDFVVVVKPKAVYLKYSEIKNNIENLILKINKKEKSNGSDSKKKEQQD